MSGSKIVLYKADISPPVRAVMVVAKLLGLELELRDVNLIGGEHLKEPYVTLNPEHTVPTLDDNGFVIWESHAICAYLVDKYAKNDQLYPKDLQLRARCTQRLFFDASSLFVRLRDCSLHVFFQGGKDVPQNKIDPMYAAYDILERFLTNSFLVGENLTIADISTALTVQLLETYAPIKAEKYPQIVAWLNRVSQTIPFFDEMNSKYPKQYREIVLASLERNKAA